MKFNRILSLILAFTLAFSCLVMGGFSAFAQEASVMLCGTWGEGLAMSESGADYTASLDLEAGNYQFNIRNNGVNFGTPLTVKDTTATVAENGVTFAEGVNAKCTLVATGGTYTFNFDANTSKLSVIKDGAMPEITSGEELEVNFGGESVTAKVGDRITYNLYLTADKPFEDIQAVLGFDADKLSLVKMSDNETEAKAYCPNSGDVIYNSDTDGVVAFNSYSASGFDFTAEKLMLTLEFDVKNGGKTNLDFTVQEMTATDGTVYYTYSTKNSDGVTLRHEALVKSTVVTPSEKLAFSGASLTLHDNLCINFKANESLFTEVGYENPYVIFELNGKEFTVSDYEVSGGKYVFDFADIAPNNMNDTVKATLYATFDGVEYVSETREYSVATYCYNMLNKYTTPAYAELQTLLVDLLNYGAMSQIYTSYKTDNLVNAKLTDAQKAWGTSEKPTYETVQNLAYKTIENPTVQWKGGGLNLVDAVTMRFKISANSGSYENLVVKAETDDRIWTIPFETFTETTGGYYVYFSGFNAGEMSETVYLTVYENGVAVSNTLSYSIESYAYSKQTSTDENLTNLLEAMMKYGNSAYAYVN